MILIITKSTDMTADLVEPVLKRRGVEYFRLNTDLLLSHSFHFSTSIEHAISTISVEGQVLDIQEVTAVWYRKPIDPIPSEIVTDPQYREGITTEARALLKNIYSLVPPSAKWVSHPERIRHAGRKLEQLQTAVKLGFNIPPTLVTNSKEEVIQFVEENKPDGTVMKTFMPVTHEDEESLRGAFTVEVNDQIIDSLDSLSLCPIIFQQKLERADELRIVVVGKQLYAGAIMQSNKLDWRANINDLKWWVATVPEFLRDACFRLVNHYGLHYGAFDVIRTPDNTFNFLEMNPNGQWGWLEIEVGLPISEAIVSTLLNE